MGLKTNIKNAFIKSLGPDAAGEGNIDQLSTDLTNAIVDWVQEQTFEIDELKCDVEVKSIQTASTRNAHVNQSVTVATAGSPAAQSGNVVTGFNGVLLPILNLRNDGKGDGGLLATSANAHINKTQKTKDNSSKIKLKKIKPGSIS
jgi:hypothetical protein